MEGCGGALEEIIVERAFPGEKNDKYRDDSRYLFMKIVCYERTHQGFDFYCEICLSHSDGSLSSRG